MLARNLQVKTISDGGELSWSKRPTQQTIAGRDHRGEHPCLRVALRRAAVRDPDQLDLRLAQRHRPIAESRRVLEAKTFDRPQPVFGFPPSRAGTKVSHPHHQVIHDEHSRILSQRARRSKAQRTIALAV
jgi:hypothetical protein